MGETAAHLRRPSFQLALQFWTRGAAEGGEMGGSALNATVSDSQLFTENAAAIVLVMHTDANI